MRNHRSHAEGMNEEEENKRGSGVNRNASFILVSEPNTETR